MECRILNGYWIFDSGAGDSGCTHDRVPGPTDRCHRDARGSGGLQGERLGPGAVVVLVQQQPSRVLRVGETELALEILVQRLGDRKTVLAGR